LIGATYSGILDVSTTSLVPATYRTLLVPFRFEQYTEQGDTTGVEQDEDEDEEEEVGVDGEDEEKVGEHKSSIDVNDREDSNVGEEEDDDVEEEEEEEDKGVQDDRDGGRGGKQGGNGANNCQSSSCT
jgi:hypothetical protein